MDLAARPAGAGIPHGPEIVFLPQPDDAFLRHPFLVPPDIKGLIVFMKHRYPEFILVKAVSGGQKIPGKADGLFLEIIPKGEIPQHFKKGMMPCRIPDIFKIIVFSAGPDAFLGRHRSGIVPLFITGEYAFKLDHAGIHKHEGLVVPGHQGGRPDRLVAVFFKIV